MILRDLDTLPPLPILQALQVGATMWSTLEVPRLERLARFPLVLTVAFEQLF